MTVPKIPTSGQPGATFDACGQASDMGEHAEKRKRATSAYVETVPPGK